MQVLQAEIRQSGAGGSAKALRRFGRVPAVVYGKAIPNLSIQVPEQELEQLLRHHPLSKPFTLRINGNDYNVMLYELQRHPVGGKLLHADFKQISMNERVHTSVPILITGAPEHGVASLVRHSLEVSCRAADIPEAFHVSVEGLQVGDVVLVKDLDIPDGVDVEPDETEVVVSVLPVKEKSDESAEAEAEAEAVAKEE